MASFTGQLTTNEILNTLFNMIISVQVFSDNIAQKQSLVDFARVDGSMYGDSKIYDSTYPLETVPWGQDADYDKFYKPFRPISPETQVIKLDVFRQIRLTTDQYLSKRAWGSEGSFAQFTSVMLGWISETKRIYESTLYNSYIGTAVSEAAKAVIEVPLSKITETGEAKNRLEAQTIAQKLADVFVEMNDFTSDFNDYNQLRRYDIGSLRVVWNSKYVNKINKIDLPTIFHQDGLIEKFEEFNLPPRYFGEVVTTSGTTSEHNTDIRSLIEKKYGNKDVRPGDLLPNSTEYLANEVYQQKDDIICKIMDKNSVPYMSAFEVGTTFDNPTSLFKNNFLTYGHNTLAYLKGLPFITLKTA